MTYLDLQNAVLADAFDESRRADAQRWIQARHSWLWDAQDWTFKQATDDITFTAGQQAASAPADVHAVYAIYDSNGDRLRGYKDLRQFFNRYNANLDDTCPPEAYTIVNDQILIGPQGDGTTGLIVYEKTKPTLSGNDDVTGLPDGYDLALVHGGKAEGFKLTNIPLAANFDADFTAFVTALENNWLDAVKESGQVQAPFRPGW